MNGWVYILQFTLYQLRNCNMNTIFGRRNDDLRRTKDLEEMNMQHAGAEFSRDFGFAVLRFFFCFRSSLR